MEINNSMTVKTIPATNNVAPVKAVVKVDKSTNDSLQPNTINIKEIRDIANQNNDEGVILSVPDKALVSAIEHINKVVSGSNVEFRHSIHKQTNSVIITLIDKDTNDVILEIPPEKVLDAYVERMEINGLMVDERR